MNRLQGQIVHIEKSGNLSLVSVRLSNEITFKSIFIHSSNKEETLKVGASIKLLFKESEVVIGTVTDHQVSLQNRIAGKITHIESGKLISKIVLKTDLAEVRSIISTNAVRTLGLQPGMEVLAMIKLNEMMIGE